MDDLLALELLIELGTAIKALCGEHHLYRFPDCEACREEWPAYFAAVARTTSTQHRGTSTTT